MPVQFNIDSRHNEDARYKKILFGYDGKLLEVELNELQDIFNTRLGRLVDKVFGSRPLYVGTYAFAAGSLTITNEVIAHNKELIILPTASIAMTNGDTVYLNIQENTLKNTDTVRQYGYLQGGTVPNQMLDDRIGVETTKRVQVSYQLTKTNTGTGVFLKLGTLASSAFVKATDYVDSDLYKEIRRLAREVIAETGGIQAQLNAHAASTTAHANATQSANGFMSSSDKTKLDGVATGAEVNQNAFATVKVGTTDLVADSKTDTVTITAGNAVTLTPDAATDSFSIAVPNATTAANGAMSSTDKQKLDGIQSGSEVNQNAFSNVAVGGTTLAADSKTDTLTIAAGNAVTLTADAAADSLTIAVNDATSGTSGAMSAADKQKLDSITPGAGVTQNAFSYVSAGGTTITAEVAMDTLTFKSGTGVSIAGSDVDDSVTIGLNAATTANQGAMSAADKQKLDGIATGAEVNQNAFTTITVGATNVVADAKTDTLTMTAGGAITLTADATAGSVTIAHTDTSAQASVDNTGNTFIQDITLDTYGHITAIGSGAPADATTSVSGFMSAADKTKLNGISAGATKAASSATNGNIQIDGAQTVVYAHPTGDGSSHVPATGTTNNGKVLKAGSTANSAAWGSVNGSEIVQDASNRLVTDTEKTTWNGKASTAVATTSANGLMSSTDKSKLDGVAAGAEVNQNAFTTVAVSGQTNVVADAKADTLTLAAGAGLDITTNATTDTVTFTPKTATTAQAGIVQLTDGIASTSTSTAATAASAKKAYDDAVAWAKSFGLGDAAKVLTDADFNSLDATGFYLMQGTAMVNNPFSASTSVCVINIKLSNTDRKQIAMNIGDYDILTRYQVTSTWGNWTKVISMNADGVANVPGKLKATDVIEGWMLAETSSGLLIGKDPNGGTGYTSDRHVLSCSGNGYFAFDDSVGAMVMSAGLVRLVCHTGDATFRMEKFNGDGANLVVATVNGSSDRALKKNIEDYDKSALYEINTTPIRNYNFKEEVDGVDRPHVGIIVQEAPLEVIGAGGTSVDLYAMIAMSWKAHQEQSSEMAGVKAELEASKQEVATLKEQMANVLARLEALENK